MPHLGESVSSGVLLAWQVSPGQWVDYGAVLFEVESDKTTLEVTATEAGVLGNVSCTAGESRAVGEQLAWIFAARRHVAVEDEARPRLSPLIRRLLQEAGLDAGEVTGTGPGGRITAEDVVCARAARDISRQEEP